MFIPILNCKKECSPNQQKLYGSGSSSSSVKFGRLASAPAPWHAKLLLLFQSLYLAVDKLTTKNIMGVTNKTTSSGIKT